MSAPRVTGAQLVATPTLQSPGILFPRIGVIRTKSSVVVGSVPSVSVCFGIQFSHGKSQYAAFHWKPTTIPCKIVEKSPSRTGRAQVRGSRVVLQSARASPDLYTLQICSQAVWRDCVQTSLGETSDPPEERHGLSVYVKDLHLTDPNQLPLGRTDPNRIRTCLYSQVLSAESVVIDQRVSSWLDVTCPKLTISEGRAVIGCMRDYRESESIELDI